MLALAAMILVAGVLGLRAAARERRRRLRGRRLRVARANAMAVFEDHAAGRITSEEAARRLMGDGC